MIAQCWLHIGTEKTGSTSIQTLLARNRAGLLARGWLYPESTGARTHFSLVAYSLDDERPDSTRRVLGVGHKISLEEFRRQLTRSIQTEIAAGGAANLLLSSELLGTRLTRPTEIVRLKSLCNSLALNTKVIVYIRNQVDFLVSRYTNVIWEGGTGDFNFDRRTPLADYALLLDRWSEIFGKENIVVRRFEISDFPDDDVLRDFADAIELDIAGLERPLRSNPSLDAESLAFLRALNRRLPSRLSQRLSPWRGALVRVLQRRRGGTKFLIPQGLATRIEGAYRESNERVSSEYFGSRYQPLFLPPTLACETAQPSGIRPVTALQIAGFAALGLLRDRVRRLVRRER